VSPKNENQENIMTMNNKPNLYGNFKASHHDMEILKKTDETLNTSKESRAGSKKSAIRKQLGQKGGNNVDIDSLLRRGLLGKTSQMQNAHLKRNSASGETKAIVEEIKSKLPFLHY
jgi:hypothetical protein